MRDFKKDLDICQKATSGPWSLKIKGNSVQSYAIEGICSGMKMHGKDAEFISAAREGWSEAINRAIAAEAETEKLKVARDCFKDTCNDYDVLVNKVRIERNKLIEQKNKLKAEVERITEYNDGLESTICVLEAENEKLRAQRTEDILLMEETLEVHKLSLATVVKLRKALALAHSMILGGEQHTEQSRQVIEGALGLL